MLSKQSVSQASILLSAFAILGGLLGYFREGLVAYTFGPGAGLDAYLAAFLIPTLFMNILNSTLPFVFINVLNRIRFEAGDEVGWAFAMHSLKRIFVFFLVLTGGCMLLTRPIIHVVAMGFSETQYILARNFFFILAPVILLSGVFIYATAILQSFKHFWWPAFLGFCINWFPIIAILIWGRRIGLPSLAWGILAAYVFQCIVILYVLVKNRLPAGPKPKSLPHINRGEWIHFILPLVLLFILDQVNLVVTRDLASLLEKGSISVLYFSNILLQLLQMVITVPVCRAIYPEATSSYTEGEKEKVREKFLIAIRVFLMVTIPIVFGIAVLRNEIIQLLFEHGAFVKEYTHVTATVFFIYALAMIPIGLGTILSNILFSLRKVWIVLSVEFFTMIVNLVAALLLMHTYRVAGLAIANLLVTVLNFVGVLGYLQARVYKITWQEVYFPALKMLGLGLGMAAFCLAIKAGWGKEASSAHLPSALHIGVNVALCVLFYTGVGYWLKVGEMIYFVDKIRHAIRL